LSVTEKGIEPPSEPLFEWASRLQLLFPKVRTYEVSLNPASVAANTVAEQTFTVTGLTTKDIITVNSPALTAGLTVTSERVSAANTLALTFFNNTGGAIDEASGTYKILAIRI